jgi:nucleotide-binding universal stress UspA family protein
MKNGKDRFGETMRLVRQARENIYFAEKDRQLIKRLRTHLRKAERKEAEDLRSKDQPQGKTPAAAKLRLVTRATPRLAPANVRKNVPVAKPYLVPVDFSKNSEIALKEAIALAREKKGELILVHVIPINAMFTVRASVIRRLKSLEKEVQEKMRKLIEHMRLKPGSYHTIFAIGGDTAWTIADLAKKWRAVMIIMGSRGMRGLQRLMLGSVAERTLRYAECPVLIVKK